jgi:hypothetical protein
MPPRPSIHFGPALLWAITIQPHDKLSTAPIQMGQMEVCCCIYAYTFLSCQCVIGLISSGTSRNIETVLGSTSEGMRSKIKETMQPSTLLPLVTSQSASNRTTPCFVDHTHDKIGLTYGLDNNQSCGNLPSLSLLDDLPDHDRTVSSDLRGAAESQPIVNDWNLQ